VVSNMPRPGTQPPLRAESHRGGDVHWNGNWRQDHRYDWRNYRHHHRSQFHLGFYFDPYGWGYQPFSIGWRLWPNYYSSNYWINDPWMYRLPYAPPGYVWVRYWNDAVLVDRWSGTVVDVIPGFFW
jgi:Ni/Co efflux regulator RcnB